MTEKLVFQKIEKALQSLHQALVPPPANDQERDGAILRFECCFELTWKTAKKALELQGISSQSPRSVIRDVAQQGWITDASLWMEFLECRNLTSHTYEEANAQRVFLVARKFQVEASLLIARIKAL